MKELDFFRIKELVTKLTLENPDERVIIEDAIKVLEAIKINGT